MLLTWQTVDVTGEASGSDRGHRGVLANDWVEIGVPPHRGKEL